jgi:hypothetical protein
VGSVAIPNRSELDFSMRESRLENAWGQKVVGRKKQLRLHHALLSIHAQTLVSACPQVGPPTPREHSKCP